MDTFVLETRPAEHFNRASSCFTQQVARVGSLPVTPSGFAATGASRLTELLRDAT